MKIKIIFDVPVGHQHGITKGRIFDTLPKDGSGQWIMGGDGEPVKVHTHEYEALKTEKEDDFPSLDDSLAERMPDYERKIKNKHKYE